MNTNYLDSPSVEDNIENSSNEGILEQAESQPKPSGFAGTLRKLGKKLKPQRSHTKDLQGFTPQSTPDAPHRIFKTPLNFLYPPVPYILKTCTQDIEKRGIESKGIYRVNGVKTRVDALAEEFEEIEDKCRSTTGSSSSILSSKSVDLSAYASNFLKFLKMNLINLTTFLKLLQSTHDVSSLLKRWLQQLPEPLFTYRQILIHFIFFRNLILPRKIFFLSRI